MAITVCKTVSTRRMKTPLAQCFALLLELTQWFVVMVSLRWRVHDVAYMPIKLNCLTKISGVDLSKVINCGPNPHLLGTFSAGVAIHGTHSKAIPDITAFADCAVHCHKAGIETCRWWTMYQDKGTCFFFPKKGIYTYSVMRNVMSGQWHTDHSTNCTGWFHARF